MRLPRINILGVGISAINLQQAVRQIDEWIARRDAQYVNVCTVHTVMECQNESACGGWSNASGLSTPDGMPLVWLGQLHGYDTPGGSTAPI